MSVVFNSIISVTAMCGALFAQGRPAAQETGPVFRAESSLVLVPFHVIRDKQFVKTLTAKDVIVLGDGEPREISLFEGGQDGGRRIPVEMMLLFSTETNVGASHLLDPLVFKAALLDSLPNAQLAVYGFENLLMPFCGPTRDPKALKKAIEKVVQYSQEMNPLAHPRGLGLRRFSPPPRGSVPLDPSVQDPLKRQPVGWVYPAIAVAAEAAAARRGDARRLIVVFACANGNEALAEDAAVTARQLGISVYPVLLEEYRLLLSIAKAGDPLLSAWTVRYRETFMGLGEATGGLAFAPERVTLDVMRNILTDVAEHVRSEYIAAFKPERSPGGPKQHRVEVRLRSEELGEVQGGSRVVVH